MSALHNQLATAEKDDVSRGIRVLLRTPLIVQSVDGDGFDLVRRRQEPIRQWFDYHCGWQLLVEPRLGYARLMKVGTVDDASRPARRLRTGRAPFDRRRYVLFCVVAAELLDSPVTTIGLLADRVAQACAVDDALPVFDSSLRSERMALVDVLRLMEQLGTIEAVDGASDSFVESGAAKVLYRVDATLLVRLLAAPRGASALAVPAEEMALRFEELITALGEESRYGVREPGADSAEGAGSDVRRGLWLRHSILRRLLDEPVVYRHELTGGQLEYLASLTGRTIMRRATEQAGLVLEERAEGYLVVDPDAVATDVTFPDGVSTAKVTALLLLDHLAGRQDVAVSMGELAAHAGQVLAEHPTWARTYQGADGVQRLTSEAVTVLTQFRLVTRDGELVRALPAAARYAVSVSAVSGPAPAPASAEVSMESPEGSL